jgi:hypothetical protein
MTRKRDETIHQRQSPRWLLFYLHAAVVFIYIFNYLVGYSYEVWDYFWRDLGDWTLVWFLPLSIHFFWLRYTQSVNDGKQIFRRRKEYEQLFEGEDTPELDENSPQKRLQER